MFKRKPAAFGAALVSLLAIPAIALGGAPGTAGNQTVQLSARVTPHGAASQHAGLSVDVKYHSVDGTRITNATNAITLTLPAGMSINVHAAAQCSFAKLVAANGNVSVCPKASLIGGGTTVVDARPTAANPLTFPAVAYNLKGAHHNDVMLYIHTPFGNLYEYFNILPGHRERLSASSDPPAAGSTSNFTLQEVKLKLHDSSNHKSYITNPPSCHKTWAFGISISSYALAAGSPTPPSASATDAAACTAAKS